MATRNLNIRIDPFIYDCLNRRARQLGFATLSDLIKSLIRYDLLVAKPHTATGDLHRYTPDEQARLDRRIAEAFLAGETMGGSWMEKVIARVVAEMGLPDGPDPASVSGKVQKMLKSGRA